MTINKEYFKGVWENKDIPNFSYNDDADIALYIGENIINISIIKKGKDTISYFANDFNFKEETKDIFKLILIESDFDDRRNYELKGKLLNRLKPKSFVIELANYGERYFEKK